MRFQHRIWLVLSFVCIIIACDDGQQLIKKIESIKKTGDADARLGLAMADSLDFEMRDASEYVHNKYDLLRLRLNDKADIMPTSDQTALYLADYFEKHGTEREKQEAYYYAGSVFRDLKDTPRALEYFHKAEEIAENHNGCDSLMLRNTYSQLNFLLYCVQDYHKSLSYAKKEYELSVKMKRIAYNSIIHMGVANLYLNRKEDAMKWFNRELERLKDKNAEKELNDTTKASITYTLLQHYSFLGEEDKADQCIELLDKINVPKQYTHQDLAEALYYEMKEEQDSALAIYKHVLEATTDLWDKYNACRNMIRIYYNRGEKVKAADHTAIYFQTYDSLDIGKRQELAATVNNQYLYHLDEQKEHRLKAHIDKQNNVITFISIFIPIVLLILAFSYYYRKSQSQKKELELSNNLISITKNKNELLDLLHQVEAENSLLKNNLIKEKTTQNSLKTEHDTLIEEVEKYKNAIKEKQKELNEKTESLRVLRHFTTMADLENEAEEIIETVKRSSDGMTNLKPKDQLQLIKAVNKLYPDFQEKLTANFGVLKGNQLLVCYLMKIGMSGGQIEKMVDMSRASVWRWIKKYKETMGE